MREEIEQTLAEAKGAVLLISAGIIISCRRGERPVILPVILSPSRFEHTPLARFQSVNLRYPVSHDSPSLSGAERPPAPRLWEKRAAFACGVAFVTVLLFLAHAVPEPTSFQDHVFRIVLALAGAGIAAVPSGLLGLQPPPS